jgi:hypothetical protein
VVIGSRAYQVIWIEYTIEAGPERLSLPIRERGDGIVRRSLVAATGW